MKMKAVALHGHTLLAVALAAVGWTPSRGSTEEEDRQVEKGLLMS